MVGDKVKERIHKKKDKLIIFNLIVILILILIICFFTIFRISEVEVEGNVRYTEEEIKSLVLDGKYGSNALVLYLKQKYGEQKEIPFIQEIDVEIKIPNKVKITVYEKVVTGYVDYMGCLLYTS